MWLRTIGRLACAGVLLGLAAACSATTSGGGAPPITAVPHPSRLVTPTPLVSPPTSAPITFPTEPTEPTAEPTTGAATSGVADTYVRQCARNIQSVVRADLRYARSVRVAEHHGQLYTASLLLHGAPSSIVPIPTRSGTQVPLRVECRAGARLVSADSGVVVAKVGDADGWRYEQFTAVAPDLTWPWTITGTHLGDQHLLLEIRPAVVLDSGGQVISSTVLTETVTVAVTGSVTARIEEAGETVKSNVGLIIGIIAGILGALTTLLLAVTKFRTALFDLFRRARPAPAGAGHGTPNPGRPQPRRPHPRHGEHGG